MKTIMDLLEKRGAGLALTQEDFEGLDQSIIQAFEGDDERYLEQLLDVKKDIVCIILPAEDDDDEDSEDKPEEGHDAAINIFTKYA